MVIECVQSHECEQSKPISITGDDLACMLV